jgi:hypothetical protein
LENEANDNSGIVQVGIENGEVKLFQVTDIKTMLWDLEASLVSTFQEMESSVGIASIEKGKLVETTKAGHDRMFWKTL